MRRFLTCICLWCLISLPAAAQTPEDIVRWIYTSLTAPGPAEGKGLALLSAPDQRRTYFSARLADFYDANDSWGDDLAAACVDFAFDIPGQDFDAAEIARTLSVTSRQDADLWRVTARFESFGTAAEVVYDFASDGQVWRLDDIAGEGFRVSEIPCQAKAAAAAATRYCFNAPGGNSLNLSVSESGAADFELSSWGANGHSCSASGSANPRDGGWVFEDTSFGRPCQLGLTVTPEGGIAVSDPDWHCKVHYCGQRAVLDGITFAPEHLIACGAPG